MNPSAGHTVGPRCSASVSPLPAGTSCRARCTQPDRGHLKLFVTAATAALHRLAAALFVLGAGSRSTSALAPLRHANLRATPNPSPKLTRYGKRCKPGPRHLVHHRAPGLQRLPPRAACLER
jgi:hypothetical protein